MSPRAYYGDNDPYTVQWLKNLIQKQLITSCEVEAYLA